MGTENANNTEEPLVNPDSSIQNVVASMMPGGGGDAPTDAQAPRTPADEPGDNQAPPVVPQIPAELLPKVKPAVEPEPVAAEDEITIEELNQIDIEKLAPAVKVNFARIRTKLNATEKERVDREKHIAELEAKLEAAPKDPTEAQTAWENERKELLDKIGKLDLSEDPRFQQKYSAMSKPIVETITNTIGSFDVPDIDVAGLVKRCMSANMAERGQILASALPEEVTSLAANAIMPLFAQLDTMQAARNQELDNYRETRQTIDSASAANAQAQALEARQAAKTTALAQAAETDILLKTVEGQDAWNSQVAALKSNIDTVFSSDDPLVLAKAVVESQTGQMYKQLFFDAQNKLAQYEEAIKSRNITLPHVNANGTPVKKQISKKDMKAESVAASIAASLFS